MERGRGTSSAMKNESCIYENQTVKEGPANTEVHGTQVALAKPSDPCVSASMIICV